MNKNKAFPYQICYLIIAALMLVSVIFSLTRGNVTYIIEGLVMIVISLFFAFFTAKEKLTFNGRFELVSDSLEDVISGNPFVSLFMSIDIKLAWTYIIFRAYFDLGLSRWMSRVPIIGLVDDLLRSLSLPFYFFFMLTLVSLFAKKQYNKIALITGIFISVMSVGFLIDYIRGIFTGFSSLFFSNIIYILFHGYLFALFNEYTLIDDKDHDR